MKKIIVYICVLFLILSCKHKITNMSNIKIASTAKDETYKSYVKKYGLDIDSKMLGDDCPWIDNPKENIFINIPISFKIDNNTGSNLQISNIWDNNDIGLFDPIIVNNQYYDFVGTRIRIQSDESAYITMFVHFPVPVNLLDKVDYERYLNAPSSRKRDSIVINKFNPRLQKSIKDSLKKKQISIYYRTNDLKQKAMAIYCIDKNNFKVFKSDTASITIPDFKYNCD